SHAILELVPDPQVDRYQVRAEVRHEKAYETGEVGLFVGLRAYPAGDDALYFLVRVAFNDVHDVNKMFREPPPGVEAPLLKGNPAYLNPRLYAEHKGEPLWDVAIAGLRPELFKAAGPGGGQWRQLTLDVSPEGVRGTWGANEEIGTLPTSEMEKNTRQALYD